MGGYLGSPPEVSSLLRRCLVTEATTPLALRSDVVATVLDDGAVLLDLESKYFYALNPSGWALVQLFEAGSTPDEAIRRCREWSGGNGRVDAEQAVRFLLDEGLVEPCPAPGEAQVNPPQPWGAPTIEKQAEPLQKVIVSAFD